MALSSRPEPISPPCNRARRGHGRADGRPDAAPGAARGSRSWSGARASGLGCSFFAGGMLAPWCEAESADPVIRDLGMEALSFWTRDRAGGDAGGQPRRSRRRATCRNCAASPAARRITRRSTPPRSRASNPISAAVSRPACSSATKRISNRDTRSRRCTTMLAEHAQRDDPFRGRPCRRGQRRLDHRRARPRRPRPPAGPARREGRDGRAAQRGDFARAARAARASAIPRLHRAAARTICSWSARR